jgi:hypothetical protein
MHFIALSVMSALGSPQCYQDFMRAPDAAATEIVPCVESTPRASETASSIHRISFDCVAGGT